MSLQSLRLIILTMMLASLALLAWHSVGMNKVYALQQNDILEYTAFSDSNHGGKSQIAFEWKNQGPSFDCTIDPSYAWPYCEVSFQIRQYESPLDLTQFDFVRLKIKSTGDGPQNIKVYLRHYNPAYSSREVANSLKINQLQFDPNLEVYPLEIPLSTFVVPPWWLNEAKLSPLHAGQELDKIVFIEIATGDYRQAGKHSVTIEAIEFHGKWLSYEKLVSFILLGWLAFGLMALISGSLKSRKEVQSERRTKKALQDINQALSLEKIELQEQAQRDHLTGLLNRFGLRQHLLQAVNNIHNNQSQLSLILIDIDHFKNINDTHGHDIGDMVLMQFSQLLGSSVRESDSVGRWGGEEFILLCPGSRLQQACKLAENLRQQVQQANWPKEIKLTGSFGIAQMKQGESIGSVLKRTDLALYEAKNSGRNKVEFSQ